MARVQWEGEQFHISVGIGTTWPITHLGIRGNINASGFVNSTVLQSVSNAYLATTGGSVGINTTAPTHLLDVAGSFNATSAGTSLRVTAAGDVVIRLG